MTRFEINRNFTNNLEIERTKLGLSQKEMASKLEISLSSYKRLVNMTTTKIDIFTIYRLYMLTGKMLCEFVGVKDTRTEMVRKMAGLSTQQMAFVDSMIDFECNFKHLTPDAEDYISVYVPTGNMEDGMIYDSVNVEKINISAYKKKYGDKITCGIKITSNHLHPVYNLGDILLVSRRPIRDGDTGVFFNRENGCAYIRKFYQTMPCILEPINNLGKTFYVNSQDKADMDKWIKFGVILTKMR